MIIIKPLKLFEAGLCLLLICFALIPQSISAQRDIDLQQGIIPGPVRFNIQDFNQLFGWPRSMNGQVPLWGRSPTIVDIDGNNDWELSILTSEGILYGYQHDGANFPGFPMQTYHGNRPAPWVNATQNSTSAVIDIDDDGSDELLFISDLGFLHVIDQNGDQREPFPLDISRDIKAGVPAVIDINNDESIDIIFNTFSIHPDSQGTDGWINVLDSDGTVLEGWPVAYRSPSGSSPSTGDITGGDDIEIVIGNARRLDDPAQIFAWRSDGTLVENFPTGSFETIHGAPALANLDEDDKLEIIFWANSLDDNGTGIYAYNGNGELLDGFPLECPIGHPEGNPAIADITGDGIPEIVFGSFNQGEGGNLYAWSANGELLENFPIELNAPVAGSVILADVSGDRVSDIIVVLAPAGDNLSAITAISGEGDVIEGFPLSMARWGRAVIAGTPTIWDIDRDGDMDLIAVTTARRLLIWDTPGLVGNDVWVTYKADMERTGRRPADGSNAVKDESRTGLPQQFSISMYPNPFNATAQITLVSHIAGYARIELINIEGRRVGVLYEGAVAAGYTQFRLAAADFNLSAGLYFCRASLNHRSSLLRVVYIP